MQKVTLIIVFMFLLPLAAAAQGNRFTRHNCIAPPEGDSITTRGASSARRKMGGLRSDWKADKVYRVPVILMEFNDQQFSMEKPQATYDSLFNYPGYNRQHGPGCVADYFRDQSGGLFNPVFDVVGPIRLDFSCKDSSISGYGSKLLRSAAQKADSLLDYTQYDWDGAGSVTQIVFVYAGYGANENSKKAEGCIWPNTGFFTTLRLGNIRLSQYSASAERWVDDTLCGIGTICHEFSHCLGLPDIYPTGGDEYSVLDEWDLMDGGNFSDDGWCPPNYTAHEKELLGWHTPIELTASQAVADLRPLSQGGEAYRITNDGNADEYYLLENRQRQGWDYFLPGHGLTVIHIDFRLSDWLGNNVNSVAKHHRYDFIHASNHNYDYYVDFYSDRGHYEDGRSLYLKDSAFPLVNDTLAVTQLTDTSLPAATLFKPNAHGTLFMGRPLIDIQESAEGLVSFQFYETVDAGIQVIPSSDEVSEAAYNLHGQRLGSLSRQGVYIKEGKKLFSPNIWKYHK